MSFWSQVIGNDRPMVGGLPEISVFMTANPEHSASPRWFALVNDRIFTTPRQSLPVSLLRALASVPADHALIRDHQSSQDITIDDSTTVDLADGNVFVTRLRSACSEPGPCSAPAKMALAVDDRFELISISGLTLEVLLSLFDLPPDTRVVRDLESPHDEPLSPHALVRFVDGPTFTTRGPQPRHIDVAVVTTAGSFPDEGFERLPINQPVNVQLARATKALKIVDTTDWIATVGTRELDTDKSYADNGLCGRVEITYGKREGGGGTAR